MKETMKFHVPGMSCDRCTAAITKSVKVKYPAAQVENDLAAKTVFVSSQSAQADI